PPPAPPGDTGKPLGPDVQEHLYNLAGKTLQVIDGLVAIPWELVHIVLGTSLAGGRLLFGSIRQTILFFVSRRFRRETAYPLIRSLLVLNWKRISLQVIHTKDMFVLLERYAAGRALTPAEKKLVKTQLLDIAKAVPALGIFALPGGALLLPILAKLLPFDLFPSAFNMSQEQIDDVHRRKLRAVTSKLPRESIPQWAADSLFPRWTDDGAAATDASAPPSGSTPPPLPPGEQNAGPGEGAPPELPA
ncbi:MAG: hypothetical protein HY719_15115, partial [Planctomycetes bacterium]|nr:hypothetical protein [Planctomycetota bacterium]